MSSIFQQQCIEMAERMCNPPIVHLPVNDVLANEINKYLDQTKRPTKAAIRAIIANNRNKGE